MKNLYIYHFSKKKQKKEYFEQRVKLIHDKMTKSHQNDEARIKMLKESITKQSDDFYAEKANRELFESRKEKGLKGLEGKLASQVSEDELDRRELENNVNRHIEDKFTNVRHEILGEKKRKDFTEGTSIKNLNDGITQLQSMISDERKNRYDFIDKFLIKKKREEGYEILIKQLGDEILRLNEGLSVARRNREDYHNKIIRHLDEVQNKLYRELAVIHFLKN